MPGLVTFDLMAICVLVSVLQDNDSFVESINDIIGF